MKQAGIFLCCLCAAASFVFFAGAARAEDPAAVQNQTQPAPAGQLSAEDRELVENLELLKNLGLYDNEDMDMLLTLDVLTANE